MFGATMLHIVIWSSYTPIAWLMNKWLFYALNCLHPAGRISFTEWDTWTKGTQWRKVILLSIIKVCGVLFFFFLRVPMQAGSVLETCRFAGGIVHFSACPGTLFHWFTSDALLECFAFLSLFLFYCAVKSVLAVFLTDLLSSFHGCPALMLCKNICPFSSEASSLSFIYTWLSVQLTGQYKEAIFLTGRKIVHVINHKERKQMFSNTLFKDWMNSWLSVMSTLTWSNLYPHLCVHVYVSTFMLLTQYSLL